MPAAWTAGSGVLRLMTGLALCLAHKSNRGEPGSFFLALCLEDWLGKKQTADCSQKMWPLDRAAGLIHQSHFAEYNLVLSS